MMKKQIVFAALILGAWTGSALAQDGSAGATTSSGRGTFGLGAEQQLIEGPGNIQGARGAALVYDMGHLRIDGILGFVSSNGTAIDLAGRVLWVLHSTSNADFSLGGGLGMLHRNPDGPNSSTNFHLEGLAQIRVFLASNVALSSTFGLGVGLVDGGDDVFGFGGQFLGSAGLVYYFR